jgi:glycosyltransferase involved in cell wall biosynthesis
VTVTGKVARPEAVLNALDLGMLASLGSEAIARAALELMATGIPLISSTTGVMPDLIPTKYSFEPGDTQAMAERMIEALDADWRSELANYCHKRVFEGGLRLEDFLAKTLEVYEPIVQARA